MSELQTGQESASKVLTALVPRSTLSELAVLAHQRDRSVSAEVRLALRAHIRREAAPAVEEPS